MTKNCPRQKGVGSKEEGDDDERKSSNCKMMRASSSFKNPRIVRVSRTFGGKDRHSKVCTVRGLRDRRIRLSVPTAIQLYDLQDRLGLTQPGKVIDWLIDAAKHEIDILPPLPMLPTNFLHYFHQPPSILANANYNHMITTSSSPHDDILSPNLYKEREGWNIINTSTASLGLSHDNHVDGEGGFGGFVPQLSSAAHNFFPLNSQFSVPSMMPYSSNYFQLDTTPNLSLSQIGGGFSDHHHPVSNCSLLSSQIYMCPSASSISTPPPFDDHQFRQINHSINSPIKSFSSLHETSKQDQDRSS